MPELPEVEVVRRGLAEHVVGRAVAAVEVRHPRAVRRHLPGAPDFAARLAWRTVTAARRRGKYLWLELNGEQDAVLARARSALPSILTASPDLSPTEALVSRSAFTYVPMPPFQSRSTSAVSIARISSAGVSALTSSAMPSATRTCADTGTDFALRGYTPPPELSREAS